MIKRTSFVAVLAAALLGPPLLIASAATPVVLHNPWLVNDRVADTHNMTTMGATYINAYTPNGVVPPTSDEGKAINIYDNQKRRLYHWADEPPSVGGDINDPTYNQNVFGWSLCGRHASQGCTLAKAAGLGQRRISLPGHWIYEVRYGDGSWHTYDTMTTMYLFNKASPRKVASCDEMKADSTLLANAVADGRACPGFLLCGDTASWFQTAVNSWGDSGDSAVTPTWTGNMDLRSGQVFKRTWESWVSQHPPIGGGGTPPYHHEASHDNQDTVNYPYWEPYRLTAAQGSAINISYNPTFRRWANGTDTLTPDFRSAAYQALLYSSTNTAAYNDDSLTPDLHTATVGTLGEAVFKISVPYYITDANFSGDFVKTNSGDVCNVQVSSTGTSWTTVWTASSLGTTHVANQPLRTNVFGLYQTWYIKVQFKGTVAKSDAGVSNLVVATTFDHNKGAMAYLDKGTNHITVTMDNPQDLGSTSRLKVTYKWKEYSGADWTIDKTYVKYVSASPTSITLTTGGTKVPRTEYIQMEVVPTPAPDITPPAAVADLRSGGAASRTSVPLNWTAPGNDANIGEATGYDLRYSTSTIDASNFSSASQAANIPVPSVAGGTDTFTVTGLTPSTIYYFAIKAFDDDGNTATISNVASVTTMAADTQAPNPITNLAAATTATLGRYNLTWTAPSDNGNGYVAAYDLRWSTSLITAGNFSSATPVTGLSAPKSAGGAESFAANGLPTGVMAYFAIKAADDSGNASAISNVPSAKAMIGTMTFQNGLNGYLGVQDTYMSAAAVTTKYEGSTYLQVVGFSGLATTNRRRAIVKFDLSSLPTAAVITKATLYLYSYSNEQHDASGGYYGAYHVYTPWAASAVSWNMPWAVSGGADIDPSPDTQTAKQTATGVWYAFDVTTRARNYIANPGNNNGWVIRCTNETLLNQDWFYACEEPTNTTLRPKLVVSDAPLVTDAVPPPAVSDLAASSATGTSITLTWTSPVDYADGGVGPFACASYNLRYSTNPITNDATFAAATAVSTAVPGAPGTPQTRVVTGLQSQRTYYFAIKSTDGGGNVSPLSNVPTGTTLPPDVTAPNWIGNLRAKPSKTGGVDLTWTASADYGYNGAGPFTCASYDLRYSTSPIRYDDGDVTWNAATHVTGLPAPQAPGTAETFAVVGLTVGTRYYFAIKSNDDALPVNASQVSNSASSMPPILGEKVLQIGLNSYTGCTDSYYVGNSTSNYYNMERMTVCGYADLGVGNIQRGILKFDLASLPAGATLTSATLSLYSYDPVQVKGSTGFYGVYPVSKAWTDSQMSWTVAKTGINWTTAGGDFAATADATSSKQGVASVWYPFDVKARVQAWLASPTSNNGWIVKCADENAHNQDRFYQSDTANAIFRPKLVISDLAAPVPGDINGDGTVDVVDLLTLAEAWNTVCGTDRTYDPLCDLNSDGSVDVVDLLTLVENWP